MARTVQQIQQSIITVLVSEMAAINIVIDPATWSRTNIFRLLVTVFASCAFVLESIFDVHTNDTEEALRQQKAHTPRWYANKALAYQHGHSLIPEDDIYDNTGLTDEQIEAAKIVKYSAVIKQANQYGVVYLRVKLATAQGSDLAPLNEEQLEGVKEYFQQIEDAGVLLVIESLPADYLKMAWTIYYDPLILNSQGGRLDGADSDPVGNAIREYLKNLPFNGTFVLQFITDAVQQVEGVVIPEITEAFAKYGLLNYTGINVFYNPDAGYLRFYDPADLQISYIPQSAIK